MAISLPTTGIADSIIMAGFGGLGDFQKYSSH